ncbi:hypothetical protein [Sporolactobacillus laevolacticus]|uniref:Uncharacterized protein n=1 Tax=Sporolactobacillus laevolacticus DSM 442 TaxID=1395513 RepID=V6J443_9BACL|nr:hypothetical protein [Sporolactobacillus laevolacticus]EST11489.1 hypothetical protein P343_11550 [Sporolactobacillus laevolacticus DSM 442]
MDFFDLVLALLDLLFFRQHRIQENLEYLEGEEWFKRMYGRKLLNDNKFRGFIKRYNLKKIVRDDEKKEKFKLELKQWVEENTR